MGQNTCSRHAIYSYELIIAKFIQNSYELT